MTITNKIALYGFNNLTKNLSFSLYRVHYISSDQEIKHYNAFINKTYCSEMLETLLTKVCHAIGGNVLNIASQDYTPQGASVTLMISEEAKPESLVAHLDKSHLCIHTYPEENNQNGIAIFRADIELSTCGVISPLNVLDYVVNTFSADVIDIDYRIRGMTRDKQGNKHYNDHSIDQISHHLTQETLSKYKVNDSAMTSKNLFHCKLVRSSIDINKHIFTIGNHPHNLQDKSIIKNRLANELSDLFFNN